MKQKKVTIKEIADMTGVSIATVSHVINHTRYVSPELVEKVQECMHKTGYEEKVTQKIKNMRLGKKACIICIFPNWHSVLFTNIMIALKKICTENGYQFCSMCSDNSLKEEQRILEHIIQDKTVAGVFLVPLSSSAKQYEKFYNTGIPFVCIERPLNGIDVETVTFQYRKALLEGMNYLIECGHENIMFLCEEADNLAVEEEIKGYYDALRKSGRTENDGNIVEINLMGDPVASQQRIQKALVRKMPTAVITSGNRVTEYLMRVVKNMGINCPDELSIVGFGDEAWLELLNPPLTVLKRDVNSLCGLAAKCLFRKIEYEKHVGGNYAVNIELKLRSSCRILDNGPYGEKPVSPETIVISPKEKKFLRNSKFRVAISFHYTGTAWAELHEEGIRDELEQFGIEVISVMDAHFDADLQKAQLESIGIQKPDAVIAIPTDDKKTAEAFEKLSRRTKLVFISNIPENMARNSYVSCVSVNESDNGANAGRMLGEYFLEQENVKVGFVIHGATFQATRARDRAARKVLKENYPNIEVVSSQGFVTINNAYQICKEMVKANPEIKALYVSWDQPALQVIKALKDLKREDIAVFTTDLDVDIAKYIKEGIVKGLSTQRPYEQGKALALVVAKALANDEVPKYVGVQPYTVEPQMLKRAWREIFHHQIEL